MKKFLLIIVLFSFLINGYSQYTVTKVVGTVKKKSTGELLKPGSSLNKDDKLLWSSSNDLVRTIVAGKGIFIISPSPKAQKEGSNLLEIVQFTLHIKSKEFNLSGRSENYEKLPDALVPDEKFNENNLIEPENKYLFDTKIYDVTDGGRFFLQVDYPGRAPVIKSLKTSSDTLLIAMSDFNIGDPVPAKGARYQLGYYSKEDNASVDITGITPYFDSTSQMASIIKLVVAENKKLDNDSLKQVCYSEVYQALGKPSDIIFEKIFNKIAAVR